MTSKEETALPFTSRLSGGGSCGCDTIQLGTDGLGGTGLAIWSLDFTSTSLILLEAFVLALELKQSSSELSWSVYLLGDLEKDMEIYNKRNLEHSHVYV